MRVIYSEFKSKNTINLVKNLEKKNNWKPTAYLYSGSFDKINFEADNECDFINTDKMRRGIFPKYENKNPIDKSILEKLAKYESTYFSWFEDTTGWNFSYNERREYYLNILSFWNNFIHKKKPDLMFCHSWPHSIADYPLYLLCTKIYKIKFLFINPIPFFENRLSIGNNLHNISEMFKDDYIKNLSKKNLTINKEVELFYNKISLNNPSMAKYVKIWLNLLDRVNFYSFLSEFFKLTLTLKGFKKSEICFKNSHHPLKSEKSRLNNFQYLFFRVKNYIKIERLKKFYKKKCIKKLPEKYILFLGGYQPEVLSNLISGHDEIIKSVIDRLQAFLPKDWKILYKEHPNIFKPGDKGALWRNEDFYNDLESIDKLQFVNYEANTYKVLDNSKAISTISGSIGIESVIRGKPAIVFGQSWYRYCKSINYINNNDDLKNAIDSIVMEKKINFEDVKVFLQTVFDLSNKELYEINASYYLDKKDLDQNQINILSDIVLKYFYHLYNKA